MLQITLSDVLFKDRTKYLQYYGMRLEFPKEKVEGRMQYSGHYLENLGRYVTKTPKKMYEKKTHHGLRC